MQSSSSDSLEGLALCLVIGCLGSLWLFRSLLAHTASWVINLYLTRRYPIKSEDGASHLPTCPWVWPNGQGDQAKFLESLKTGKLWREEYGAAYRIWSGYNAEVVVSRPEDVRAVFADSDKHEKAHFNNSGYLFGELLGSCLGEVSGPSRSDLLRYLGPYFTFQKSREYLPLIDHQISSYLDDLKKELLDRSLKPCHDLRLLSFWVVAEILFGPLSQSQRSELVDLIPSRESLLIEAFTRTVVRYSWSRFIPSRTNRQLREFQTKWEACVESLVKRNASFDGAAQCLMRTVHHGDIDRKAALQTLDEILFANLDVTLGGLAWTTVFLAHDGATQRALYNEIEGSGLSRSEYDYLSDSTSLLAASIVEAGRLRPPVAFSIPQAPPTPRVVSGFVVPGQTNFMVDSFAMNQAPSTWGKDATEYRPSRLLEALSAGKGQDLRYKFWRWGFGPRQCLGKHVADLTLRKAVAAIVKKYELRLDPDHSDLEARDPSSWIILPVARVVCVAREKPSTLN